MNTTFDVVRARVGPLVIGAGMAMVAVAVVGYSANHHHPQSAAPARPPATSPAPPATTKPARPSQPKPAPSAPRLRPHHVPDGGRVVAASQHATGLGGGTSQRRPSKPAPSGPAPRPPATPQPSTQSCDVGVAVLALDACVNLGGPR